jgi:alkanesulfonate monooxygenase SsuD/methylene tetrahydromethanopterin reductase-like flavin-dependent oxidoreductase (luciferase family)
VQFYYFSEQSYYPAWSEEPPKITAPSRAVDPVRAQELLRLFIEECELADELGLNIMVNEHHASYTCMSVSCLMTLGILAARTKRARLLALGVPILNRMDPFRVAEEIAYVDVLSGGRLDVGLIKGTAFEMFISNAAPVGSTERFWEAHDVIMKALTALDGPVSWQGENFEYRYMNVIPRCYQQPHPPIWMTTLSTQTARDAAARQYVLSIPANAKAARRAFPIYREAYRKAHGADAPADRFAYLGYVAVAETEEKAMELARKILHFPEASERIEPRFIAPAGAFDVAANVEFLKARSVVTHRFKTLPDGSPMSDPPTPREQVLNKVMFAGTPDQVYRQICELYDDLGGLGHFLVQMGGTMTSDEIRGSMRLFAEEVMPRLVAMHEEKSRQARTASAA